MFSTTTEHALRALRCLSRVPEGRHVVGRDLASAAGIPANYLSKLLVALGQAGILEASRGPHGGYRFRRRPTEIFLSEIVELFEGDVLARHACLFGGGRECSDESPCAAHDRWQSVRSTLIDFLESTTVDEISEAVPRPPRRREES